MQNLVTMRFGSHLYGTATAASDTDLKGVHLPAWREILLGTAKKVISTSTKEDPLARNTAADTDTESFSIQQFMKLASEGQTVALDMLFAPTWAYIAPQHPLWMEVQENRHRLVTRQYASFIGYVRSQANKYGIRGSRVAAARQAMEFLRGAETIHGATTKLSIVSEVIKRMSAETQHMAVMNIPSQQGGEILHWSVCDRKMPFTASVKSAREIMERVVQEYGHRALAAEKNEGVDWKAVSHAVRIGRQALEILRTGAVIFPRPDAEELLAIKLGLRPYSEVSDEIDRLLPAVEAAAGESSLPDQPDREWIEDFLIRAHMYAITAN